MTDLLSLAARVEAAEGPERELDVQIAVAIDWRWPDWEEGESTARGQAEKHGLPWLVERVIRGYASVWRNMPHFTASLDAAMTLVPVGFGFVVHGPSDDQFHAGCAPLWPDAWGEDRKAATPALALCAASLRARAQGAG